MPDNLFERLYNSGIRLTFLTLQDLVQPEGGLFLEDADETLVPFAECLSNLNTLNFLGVYGAYINILTRHCTRLQHLCVYTPYPLFIKDSFKVMDLIRANKQQLQTVCLVNCHDSEVLDFVKSECESFADLRAILVARVILVCREQAVIRILGHNQRSFHLALRKLKDLTNLHIILHLDKACCNCVFIFQLKHPSGKTFC